MGNKPNSTWDAIYKNEQNYQQAEYAGFGAFWIGITVGVSNVACGLCVGVLGSSTALSTAQNGATFMSMLIVIIFASALGLYAVIIGIIANTQSAGFP